MLVWWAYQIVTRRTTLAGIAIGALAAIAIVLAVRRLRRKPSAEELERVRRLSIHQEGKIGDGEVIDIDPETLHITYSYSVAGVGYIAKQEFHTIREQLPADLISAIGPASVKFDPRNPANSIIICEEWSGVRQNTGGQRFLGLRES